jgi:cytochrome c biogenesis protein CcdA
MISKGETIRTTLSAKNRSSGTISLSLVPTCSCLSVKPASVSLASGATASFDLSFDSADDEGKVFRFFIVKTDLAGEKPAYFSLRGVVRADRPVSPPLGSGVAAATAEASSFAAGGAADGALELRYYYTPGCRSCDEFLRTEIPRLESSYGLKAKVLRRDILDSKAYEELEAFASSIGTSVKAIPALRIGNVLLQGDEEIRDRLPGLFIVRGGAAEAPSAVKAESSPSRGGIDLSVLPVMLAGLIDGINPCAFTTIIFLLASLALAGRGRREVLVVGALFSLGVFLTYLGVGFGLFAALRAASAFSFAAKALRWLLFAFLLVLAALSVYDFTKIRAGKSSEILLQLPNSLKLKIHASIRTRAKSAALALSSLGLGFLVSIFEFACTGQVYLPTLAYIARQDGRTDAVLLLILYNLCFIAPLVAVFVASYLGVNSKRIAGAFQKRMGGVKLGLAALFLGLALLTLLT